MSGRGAWRIGGYVADELIGYGASAQVWRGHVGRGGEPVALKVLDLSDAAAVRAARAEAAVLSALDHPHLVRLRELVPDGESVVLVLELAAGGSLADLLARRGRLSPGEVVVALSPIAAALAYAHDAGVVHCDVSPANVLFRGDGSPLLADLGVARLVGGFDAPRSTLAYVDPGVAAGGVPSDASDVFMVAATAFHALTGSPPWTGITAEAILDQAANAEIPGFEQRLAGLPVEVADVVRRGLDPSPAARGSAAEFALDLRHAAAPVPVDLDAGPSPARGGEAGSPAPVFYAAVDGFDAVDISTDPPATDAVSRRAEARARPTSSVPGRVDGPVGYAPDRAHGAGNAGGDVVAGRGGVAGVPPAGSSAPERAHVPRHAARSKASDPPTSVQPADGPSPVLLERPDFSRPGDTRARPAVGFTPQVGMDATGGPGRLPVPRSAHSPSDVGQRDDARPAERPVRAARAARAATIDAAGPSEPPLALTHIVRARIRPPEGELPRRRLGGMHWSRNAAVVATVVLLVAGGALATWLRWTSNGSTASYRATVVAASGASAGLRVSVGPTLSVRPTLSIRPTTSAGTTMSAGSSATASRASPTQTGATTSRPTPAARKAPGTPSARPSPTSPSARPVSTPAWPRTDKAWAALLTGLDRRRQAAFATNDPAPLAEVYVDGVLLDQDRRTLAQVVRPGCRLVGLRTSYRDVHVSSIAARRSVVTTQASLSESRLQCPGQPTRVVPAHASVGMTLVLAPVGGRLLIAEISMP